MYLLQQPTSRAAHLCAALLEGYPVLPQQQAAFTGASCVCYDDPVEACQIHLLHLQQIFQAAAAPQTSKTGEQQQSCHTLFTDCSWVCLHSALKRQL
jgi:hypothetical protein